MGSESKVYSGIIIGKAYIIICAGMLNVFAIITGYLYCEKTKYSSKRLIDILFKLFFYSIMITFVFNVLIPRSLIAENLSPLKGFIPFIDGRYWYILAYIVVFFLRPVINKGIVTLSQKQLKAGLLLFFLLLSVIPTILGMDYFNIAWGYSSWWLIFCYVIGAYIKKYNIWIKINKKWILGLIMVINVLVSLIVLLFFMRHSYFGYRNTAFAYRYNNPLIVVNGICIFKLLYDVNIHSKRLRKMISELAGSSLSVYIIHAHPYMLDNIFDVLFKKLNVLVPVLELMFIPIISIVVYLLCITIDKVREGILKMLKYDNLIQIIGTKVDDILYWSEKDI